MTASCQACRAPFDDAASAVPAPIAPGRFCDRCRAVILEAEDAAAARIAPHEVFLGPSAVSLYVAAYVAGALRAGSSVAAAARARSGAPR